MSISETQLAADASAAEAALLNLCRPFVRGKLDPICSVVQPDAIPFPEDHLLVHHDHMTVVLQKHHGSPVNVHVMDERLDDNVYTRMICLTPQGSEKVVEWGIARLHFKYIPDAAREEILAKKSPLGAILIKHDVHRRVKPRYFLRFPSGGGVLSLFKPRPATPQAAYGRIGMIYCDEEPAIELLEIVVNVGPTVIADAPR